MIKKITACFLFCFLFVFNSLAQDIANYNENTPKLVIGITIDNMRAEYLTRFWDTFQKGGFRRLIENGAVSKKGRLDIHNIKTATAIATIYTGTYPSEHGIIGDQWYKQLTKQTIQCTTDDFYLTMGSDSKKGNASANMLKTFTLGDVMKEYSNFKSKVFSVALNQTPAVLSAGHSANGAFWYDTSNGKMITSSYYMDIFPDWVRAFNEKLMPDLYLQREWDLLLPAGSYKSGFTDDYLLEKGYWKKWNTFPYDLPKLSSNLASKYELLPATPFGNKLIKDFAVQLIDQYELGNDEYPDLLNINFSTLDFANKWFTPSSVEIQDLYLRLDQEIASLLSFLDKKMGKNNYLVFLTSSSTSDYPVNILKEEFNFKAGEFSPQIAMALLRAYLNVTYGNGEWIQMYNEEQIYLNHSLIEEKEKSIEDMQQKVALFLNQFEGIKAAVPASVIEKGNLNNPRFKILENSYCVQRSGDVLLLLEEGWQPTFKYNETDYSTENIVPVIFYGSLIKHTEIKEDVEAIDIVPTVCNFLNILPPDDAHGKIIYETEW
jgi:predicted AlkP superfamily pyrophosphatase or phosphodiesterase